MAQDRKFRFDHETGQFVNRMSNEAIPHDEPVILFRARDIHALPVLHFYLGVVEDPHHRQAIRDRIMEFTEFLDLHPERMKQPGITGDIELFSSRRPENLHEGRRQESPLEKRVDAIEHRDDVLESEMTKAMADIDTLNSILDGIANDATALSADFKGLEGELQAAQEAAANNQPIDLTNAILRARGAQASLDAMVAAASPAAPVVSGGADGGTGSSDQAEDEQPSGGADDTAEQAGEQSSTDDTAEQASEQTSDSTADQGGEQSSGFGGDAAEQTSDDGQQAAGDNASGSSSGDMPA